MPKIGKNTKGNDVIEHENFLYKYHKPLNSTKNRHRWVCTNVYKKCSAYAYTIGRKIPICFELKNEHTCANVSLQLFFLPFLLIFHEASIKKGL